MVKRGSAEGFTLVEYAQSFTKFADKHSVKDEYYDLNPRVNKLLDLRTFFLHIPSVYSQPPLVNSRAVQMSLNVATISHV